MTKDKIAERRRALELELNHHQSMVHAVNGAIQDCDWWLQQIADAENGRTLSGAESQLLHQAATQQ